MSKYFVHENPHYPGPVAPTPFEVRQYGALGPDATIELRSMRAEADARCEKLTNKAALAELMQGNRR
jgi:hypothetical protein